MLFIANEKSFYELLRKYLISNNLMNKELSLASFNCALAARSQELGFTRVEDYCRYLMILPFIKKLPELKLLIPHYKPIKFFQNGDVIEGLNFNLIEKLIKEQEESKHDRKEKNWVKVLTTPIEIGGKPVEEKKKVNVLSVESGEGEDAYSIGFRLKTILPDTHLPKIIAFESNNQLLEFSNKGIYNPGKVLHLKDTYRSLYLEETKSGFFKVVDEIKDIINFRKYDILFSAIDDDYLGYFHIISCINLLNFYSVEVINAILPKLALYLTPGGLILIDLSEKSGVKIPGFFKIVELGNQKVLKRTDKTFDKDSIPHEISPDCETQNNKFLQASAFFLDEKFDWAKKAIDEILAKNIDSLKGNHFQGDIYTTKKEYEKAVRQYDKVVLINPSALPGHFNAAVLSLNLKDQEKALKHLEAIERELPSIDEEMLNKNYDISVEAFKQLVQELSNAVLFDLDFTVEMARAKYLELKSTKLKVPDIEIPDLFQKKKTEQIETPKSLSPSSGEKKVVNISELPSARDYGEHDPWKKKQQEQQEKVKRDVTEEEKQNEESSAESSSTQVLQETDDDIEFKLPKVFKIKERVDTPPTKGKKRKEKKREPVSTSIPSSGKAIKPISPDSIDDDLYEEEDIYEEEQEEVDEGEELQKKPPQQLRLSIKRWRDDSSLPVKEVCLPPNFIHSMDALILKEDIEGVLILIDSYMNKVSPAQKEILSILDRTAKLFKRKARDVQKPLVYKGRLKEVYEYIQKTKRLLSEMNLLEASIQFHKILKMKAKINDLPDHQKERLLAVKEKLDAKIEKQQGFIDYYFTDPVKLFQPELWNILKSLTPPDNLLQMGKKYGLDPEYLNDNE